jgi:hypothetical protein
MTDRPNLTVVHGSKPVETIDSKAGHRARYRQVAAAQMRERGSDRLRVYTDWQHGRVVPHRITMALNLHGHQGPEVDAACGVEEPAVDMWEAGTLYPTWEQLLALAAICPQVTLAYLVLPLSDELPLQTSMRFHRVQGRPCDRLEPPPVRCYEPHVVHATVSGSL